MTIDWQHFTPWASLGGGVLIGLAASLFVLLNGRIAGISGVLGGLLAQGLTVDDAAAFGACLHGRAGDLAALDGGERGLLATDLLPHLRQLANVLSVSAC